MGEPIETVRLALRAAGVGRFDEVGGLLAEDIEWVGLAGDDGVVPSCHGRTQALAIMKRGLFARGEVEIDSLEEQGDRILVTVTGRDGGAPAAGGWVVATVHAGVITNLTAFPDESKARRAVSEGGAGVAEPNS